MCWVHMQTRDWAQSSEGRALSVEGKREDVEDEKGAQHQSWRDGSHDTVDIVFMAYVVQINNTK